MVGRKDRKSPAWHLVCSCPFRSLISVSLAEPTEMIMVAKKGSEAFSPIADDSVLELSLMVSRQQFDLLEQRAHAEGMSVAQFLRRLVHESISQESVKGS